MAKLLSALIAVALAATAVSAHHSFAAEYSANDQVTLVGTITKVEWTNPHTWFYIDVKDPQAAHKAMLLKVDDPANKNLHDITAYLATIK